MLCSHYSIPVSVACLFIVGCEAAGTDNVGKSLQEKATETLLPALDAYRESVGRYPDSLRELTVDMSWLPEDSTTHYELLEDGGFLFRFDYTGSWRTVGRPNCQYSSMTADWKCYGHF